MLEGESLEFVLRRRGMRVCDIAADYKTKTADPTFTSRSERPFWAARAHGYSERGLATHPSGGVAPPDILCILEPFFSFLKVHIIKAIV